MQARWWFVAFVKTKGDEDRILNWVQTAVAIGREYLAIVLQEMGMRSAARHLRTSPGHHDETLGSNSPSGVMPDGITAHFQTQATPDDSVRRSDRSAIAMTAPVVIDTDLERHLQFSDDALQSRMRLDDPYALIAPYTRQMMSCLLFNPDPAHILMIGLGGGSLAKFCYRHLPHAQITVVEIDTAVIALRDSFHIPADNRRFRVIHDDGASYVSGCNDRVEIILVDAYDESGVSPSLANSWFFHNAFRCLTSDGVLIMNLHGTPATFSAHLDQARSAFAGRALLVPVPSRDNALLCALAKEVPLPAAKQLFVRARYLQSKMPLNFRSYLQRLREEGRVL